jgi:UPF0755 protein
MLRRLLIIIVLLVLCAAAIAGYWLRTELITPYYAAQTGETFIEVSRGAKATAIAGLLTKSGILHNLIPFILYLRWTDSGRRIQSGEYRFSAPATPAQVAQRLIHGDVYFRSVTIPEGLTARETIELLAGNEVGDLQEMERLLLNPEWMRDFDDTASSVEGYLFPETYRFGHTVPSEEALKAMIGEFREKFARITARYPIPEGWSIQQIVTLASMIEKEAQKAEERPVIASVLLNRLYKKIPLCCDATIIYALKSSGVFDGNLRKVHLQMDSPYNTYIHAGLPPGPIANPGADSLKAALNPAMTDYYYYVSRNDGTHQFSKDLRSHTQAVARYQKSAAGRRASSRRAGK